MPLSAATSTEPDVLEPEGNATLNQRPLGRVGYTERQCVRTVEQREPDPATPTAMPAPRGVPIQVDATRADVPIESPYRGDRQTAVPHGQAELGASIHTRIAGETVRVIPGQRGGAAQEGRLEERKVAPDAPAAAADRQGGLSRE